ncbi:retron system putative HNH endonuclease [Macellibacteroides fermentans]|jgi:uncharacterized protein (TIGR02646 family)|uniref:retron system putative HNH endonuclease n=1 Tax=Macellibacteroides fermentans TaxID=879969 RepID=UPI00406D3582
MRYIHKNINSKGHKLLEDWNRLRRIANQKLVYNDFDKKKELNNLLIEEQGGICCYCQQRITELKITKTIGDAHNEHLIPQSAREDLQTNHGNLFACCCFSAGFPKNLQHCGEAKKNELIYEFIKWVDCDRYFKYNILGEITPVGPYQSYKDFVDNEVLLDTKQKKALEAIKVLNLNQSSLQEERRKDIIALIKIIDPLTVEDVRFKMEEFNSMPYIRFIDTILYYMRKKK